jgi:hypothetical protein
LVFALVDHKVGVGHLDGDLRPFAAHGVEERFADVHIQRVAEFVASRDAAGFDAGGEVARVVAAEAAAAKRTEQILQGFESQKIDGFVGNFEARFALAILRLADLATRGSLRRRGDLCRLMGIDEAFVGEALGELVDEILDGLAVQGRGILQHFPELLAHGVLGQEIAFLEGAEDSFA